MAIGSRQSIWLQGVGHAYCTRSQGLKPRPKTVAEVMDGRVSRSKAALKVTRNAVFADRICGDLEQKILRK